MLSLYSDQVPNWTTGNHGWISGREGLFSYWDSGFVNENKLTRLWSLPLTSFYNWGYECMEQYLHSPVGLMACLIKQRDNFMFTVHLLSQMQRRYKGHLWYIIVAATITNYRGTGPSVSANRWCPDSCLEQWRSAKWQNVHRKCYHSVQFWPLATHDWPTGEVLL